MKKVIILLFVIMVIFSANCLAEENFYEASSRIVRENWNDTYFNFISIEIDSPVLFVDNKKFEMIDATLLDSTNTIVPVKDFVAQFDAVYTENCDEFFIQQGNMIASGCVGNNKILVTYVNNVELNFVVELPDVVKRIDATVYIPVRALVEQVFAGNVLWNDLEKRIVLKRDYQTKRIIAGCLGDDSIMENIPCKEKITDGDGTWVIQFDRNVPDSEVKYYCDMLSNDEENIIYAQPDTVVVAVDN